MKFFKKLTESARSLAASEKVAKARAVAKSMPEKVAKEREVVKAVPEKIAKARGIVKSVPKKISTAGKVTKSTAKWLYKFATVMPVIGKAAIATTAVMATIGVKGYILSLLSSRGESGELEELVNAVIFLVIFCACVAVALIFTPADSGRSSAA